MTESNPTATSPCESKLSQLPVFTHRHQTERNQVMFILLNFAERGKKGSFHF